MTNKPLRIGTRESDLATWQARYVAHIMEKSGRQTEMRFIKTEGDRVLDTPLPLMGGKGVFTKALDDALLAGEIDIAVHSLKDIPTRMPEELVLGAVSDRDDHTDVLVTRDSATSGLKTNPGFPPAFLTDPDYEAVIASSSNRRIGQWLARYPGHRMTDIRGNIPTRLRKLSESTWDGAIFAAAGLKRLGLDHHMACVLDWMLPAPAQGALGVVTRKDRPDVREAVRPVHDPDTALCTKTERDVLYTLEGGCSAPVGAFAEIINDTVHLKVNLVNPDGTGMIRVEMSANREKAGDLGRIAAEEALKKGADTLIRDLLQNKRES